MADGIYIAIGTLFAIIASMIVGMAYRLGKDARERADLRATILETFNDRLESEVNLQCLDMEIRVIKPKLLEGINSEFADRLRSSYFRFKRISETTGKTPVILNHLDGRYGKTYSVNTIPS